jgi:hypothetical protein
MTKTQSVTKGGSVTGKSSGRLKGNRSVRTVMNEPVKGDKRHG